MRRSAMALVTTAALAACSSNPGIPDDFALLLAESPEDHPSWFLLAGDRVVAAAVAIPREELPQPVRAAVDAVAPHGELLFRGREWGPRGAGYRIEKEYVIDGHRHVRRALIDASGQVLERAHSVPLAKVPEAVLATALEVGNDLHEITIVSGPEAEEFWRAIVSSRIGRTYVVRIDLSGQLLDKRRRIGAHLDV